MKKTLAILILYIHLFNLVGPMLLHALAVYRLDRFFNEQIDKNLYSPDDLSEICIPANNPHITDWKNYVNCPGSVQFGKTAYNYIKIRMTRTAIYLVCIPNYPTTHLINQNIIEARQIPDIPVHKKHRVPFIKAIFAPLRYENICSLLPVPSLTIRKTPRCGYLSLPALVIDGPGQPPDSPLPFPDQISKGC